MLQQQRTARKRFPSPLKKPPKKSTEQTTTTSTSTTNTQIMGNGCSKNLRRLNKSGVAPNDSGSGSPSSSLSPKIVTANPAENVHKSHVIQNKANCIEIGPGEHRKSSFSVNGSSNRLQIAPSHHELPSTSKIGKTDNNGVRNAFVSRGSSNFDSDVFNLSSCIDTKSIIFDKTDSKSTSAHRPPYITRSISVDSSSDKSDEKNSEGKRFAAAAAHLQRLFKSNQNLTTSTSSPTITSAAKNEGGGGGGSLSFPKLYHRFSGSVQSLFANNLQNNRKRNLSASDTNLNRIHRRCSGLSQQQLIDNDYCPSVFYNRKARKSYSEKNLDKTQTFSRWKNQLWLKFSRKKSNPSARKS